MIGRGENVMKDEHQATYEASSQRAQYVPSGLSSGSTLNGSQQPPSSLHQIITGLHGALENAHEAEKKISGVTAKIRGHSLLEGVSLGEAKDRPEYSLDEVTNRLNAVMHSIIANLDAI